MADTLREASGRISDRNSLMSTSSFCTEHDDTCAKKRCDLGRVHVIGYATSVLSVTYWAHPGSSVTQDL